MAKKTVKVVVDELRQLGVPELTERLSSARKALFEQKMKRAELKNPLKLRWLRRDIAKILTIMNEKMAGKEAERQGGKVGEGK